MMVSPLDHDSLSVVLTHQLPILAALELDMAHPREIVFTL